MYSETQELFYLQPGEIFVTNQGTTITTVLGSCVGVCMWDEVKRIGGMNHVVIPRPLQGEEPSSKYANVGTFVLYDMMLKEGAKHHNIKCYVYGGASQLGSNGFTQKDLNVGPLNIEITFNVLEHLKLKIVGQNVAGEKGRKLKMETKEGKVDMTYLKTFDFSSEIKEIVK